MMSIVASIRRPAARNAAIPSASDVVPFCQAAPAIAVVPVSVTRKPALARAATITEGPAGSPCGATRPISISMALTTKPTTSPGTMITGFFASSDHAYAKMFSTE
jgi:hypothetical protein